MITIFLCSPRKNGTTDHLGAAFASGCNARVIALRDYAIQPCCGCNQCFANGGHCIIKNDDCAWLLEKMQESRSVVFASPIYFYALPAHFKAFIDRSQPFWNNYGTNHDISRSVAKKAAVILAAGRSRGARLFAGSLLTLKWFLKPFDYRIECVELCRGLENPQALDQWPELLEGIANKGKAFAENRHSAQMVK